MAYISSLKSHGMFFWNTQSVTKDTNYHCYTDLLVFENIIKNKSRLPPRLIISMDNTSAENKNYLYLQFCILLIILNVFREIQWIFLPVGHTHGYPDQIFSNFSRLIKSNPTGFLTIQNLFDVYFFRFFFHI